MITEQEKKERKEQSIAEILYLLSRMSYKDIPYIAQWIYEQYPELLTMEE